MATPSSILAWKISDRETWQATVHGVAKSQNNLMTQHTCMQHPFCRIKGCPGGSDGEESACNEGNLGSIPESGRSAGEWNGDPL